MTEKRRMQRGMERFHPSKAEKIWRDIVYYFPRLAREVLSGLTFVALVAFAVIAASSLC